MMKGFNITWYDDRRLCHMLGCTELMVAFKWDHAVRDFQDPEKRFPTLCCLPANRSALDPPVDECTDASRYHQVRRQNWLCLYMCYKHKRCLCMTLSKLGPTREDAAKIGTSTGCVHGCAVSTSPAAACYRHT